MSSVAADSLKLADAYIKEVNTQLDDVEGNRILGDQLARTLGLALKQVEKAEALDPLAKYDGLDCRFLKAWAIGTRGLIQNWAYAKRAAAVKDLEESISICDDVGMIHFGLGAIYSQMGRRDDAIRHIQRAVELEPENMEYRKDLGRLEGTSGVGLKLGAFRGSWKGLLVLGGLGLFGLFSGQPVFGILFLGFAGLYWWFKSRS